ncbi:Protein of uncharacterised function (DUF2806) [Klebsiella pneumoniae]|uniref:DUF2806 domain-containing protein n=1 Tax=Klebsiella pneumoniae TaxID=573 RepID=UPI000DF8F6F3|nr:DUF2806 domain-containing protein [Klebsiella pneumoniae]MCD5719504.1 DUF2806 domain-containing protein [Klebsiella pneumoniae]MCP5599675.1 DUF2806 domain-containing protein [Klebsiella pneumoniae]STV89623.1 Protein of uncharacterised function (DUF2806) [Klebsiella pneumoniae]
MSNSDVIAVVQKLAKPLYSMVRVAGPFLLSQSKTALENYSDYKLNKARLEALSILLQEEAKNISTDRAKLRAQIINSSGLERVKAQNDYDLLTKELNKLSTIDKVKDFISDDDEIDKDSYISDSWIEQFNNLASSLNEEWRKTLLAKAFALELKKSGSITIVVLNAIASFDELSFKKFGILINASIRFKDINLFPCVAFNDEMTININNEERNLIAVAYELKHLSLIEMKAGYINSGSDIVYFRYGRRVLQLKYPDNDIKEFYVIHAYFLTSLGNKIASLYEREITPLGEYMFKNLCEEAKKKGCTYKEILISDELYRDLGN